MKESTICVHTHHQEQGVNTPIDPSSANKYIGYEGNIYPRYFNTRNQEVVVEKLCQLERSEAGLIFSSGMASITTALLAVLKSGDHILLSAEIYGGTHNLILQEFEQYGIAFDFVSGGDFESAVKPNTKVIYTETPSNPLLKIVDLKAIADFAKAHNLISVVDNTFASPINQRPIDFGIDVVVHSGTKYLGGHSDLCYGAVLTNSALREKVFQKAINLGGSLNALDSYLIERSLKTLALRVEKQNENALKIAKFLDEHNSVKEVFYPGLGTHEDHEIAKKQMHGGFGGMLSFELKDAFKTDAFLSALDLITPALSLGGVETIICQPTKTSHLKMPEAERLKQGITDGLLRLSVGIENVEDLTHDLNRAIG
ncbi:MAG: PLP-dependent transferase [Cyclobacteriaceae bacterium]